MNGFFFPPYFGGIGGTSSSGAESPSASISTPPKKKSWRDRYQGFRERFGLADPEVRALIAAQIIGAPDMKGALAAMMMGPAMRADKEKERENEEMEKKRRAEDEQIRAENARLRSMQFNREEQAQRDRNRDNVRRDQDHMRALTNRRELNSQISQYELEGKLEPGLAQILRRMEPEEANVRLRDRFFPSEAEKLRDQATKLGLENQRSLIDYRAGQREAGAARADIEGQRKVLRDQVSILSSEIDDLARERGAVDQWANPKRKKSIEAEIEKKMTQREALGQRMVELGSDRSGAVFLGGLPETSAEKASPAESRSGSEEVLRSAMEEAGTPSAVVERSLQNARSLGVTDRAAELVRQGLPLLSALRQAQAEAERGRRSR